MASKYLPAIRSSPILASRAPRSSAGCALSGALHPSKRSIRRAPASDMTQQARGRAIIASSCRQRTEGRVSAADDRSKAAYGMVHVGLIRGERRSYLGAKVWLDALRSPSSGLLGQTDGRREVTPIGADAS